MTKARNSHAIYSLITIIASIYFAGATILSESSQSRTFTISIEEVSDIRFNNNLPDYQYATYELSQLVFSIEQGIPLILDSIAIYFQCLEQQAASKMILANAGVTSPDQQDFILSDFYKRSRLTKLFNFMGTSYCRRPLIICRQASTRLFLFGKHSTRAVI